MNTFGIWDLGTPQLLLILAIILLLFGGRKLPELSRSLGTSLRELRKGLSESEHEKSEKQPEKKSEQESAS